MSGYATELVGQELSNDSGFQKWHVYGTSDKGVAYALAHASSPAVFGTLFKQKIRVKELGNGVWSGRVDYGILELPEVGKSTWSFEIGTTTVRAKQALEHLDDYTVSGTAPNHKGAINVRDDGRGRKVVEGVDAKVPYLSWTETHFVNPLVITPSYVLTLESMTASMNDAPFRVWGTWELLLLGVTGAKRANEPVALSFNFGVSRTKTNQSFGDITGVDSTGWSYLWFEYDQKDDAGSKRLVAPPIAAHTERIYQESDYSQLGLPDPWNP